MTFEKYYAYNDFKKNWGSPDEMKQEVEWVMSKLLPKEDMLKGIEDLSTDKGIKFETKLKSKDIIHMYKVSAWRMQATEGWEYYYNKKKTTYRDLKNKLEKEILSDLDLFLKYFKSYDLYVQYIDDGGQYKAAKNNNDSIVSMFNNLSSSDKKKSKKELLKHFKVSKTDKKTSDLLNSTFKS